MSLSRYFTITSYVSISDILSTSCHCSCVSPDVGAHIRGPEMRLIMAPKNAVVALLRRILPAPGLPDVLSPRFYDSSHDSSHYEERRAVVMSPYYRPPVQTSTLEPC